MAFDELLRLASQAAPKTIPKGAERELKRVIGKKTQAKLLAMKPDEAVRIIVDAVQDVEHGSVEKIEELIEDKCG